MLDIWSKPYGKELARMLVDDSIDELLVTDDGNLICVGDPDQEFLDDLKAIGIEIEETEEIVCG